MSTPSKDVATTVQRLTRLPAETEWVEFKANKAEPTMIGEDISALSNAAALAHQSKAYMVWGIDDTTHDVIGTTFQPALAKGKGNEDLENWLTHLISPLIYFQFHSCQIGGLPVVLLEIDSTQTTPIAFSGIRYIRIGSYTKRLSAHPDREARLWRSFDTTPFESRPALGEVSEEQILTLLDYPSYFLLTKTPLPQNRTHIIDALQGGGLIAASPATGWSITNLGALLFARDIREFPSLARRTPRVFTYRGNDRVTLLRQQSGRLGYAAGFEQMIRYVMEQVPSEDVIEHALRTSRNNYPEVALRELIANALIHQDLAMSGTSPTVEVFSDRIEITNPGKPLVSPDRFIDASPRSRNEKLASMMRRSGICEEGGTGWDRVAAEIEFHQLPAPLIAVQDESTRVTVFSQRPLAMLDKTDRGRAIYLHACLRYVTHRPMTNTSVRDRFGLPVEASVTASRLIKEATEAGLITLYDPKAGPRARRYVPFWADPRR